MLTTLNWTSPWKPALALLAVSGLLAGCGAAGLPETPLIEASVSAGMTDAGQVLPFPAPPDGVARPFGPGPKGPGMARLNDDERAALEQLRTRLDAGELTPAEFATEVDTLLGDRFPAEGIRDGRRPPRRLARVLGLTADQVQQAQEIFRETRRAVRRQRLETMASIRQVLTTEQRAQLDEIRANCAGELRAAGRDGKGVGRGMMLRGGRGGAGFRAEALRVCLAEQLGLSAEQQEQIQALRAEGREQVEALAAAGRAQFEALLTPEQAAAFSELRSRWGSSPPQRPGRGGARLVPDGQ